MPTECSLFWINFSQIYHIHSEQHQKVELNIEKKNACRLRVNFIFYHTVFHLGQAVTSFYRTCRVNQYYVVVLKYIPHIREVCDLPHPLWFTYGRYVDKNICISCLVICSKFPNLINPINTLRFLSQDYNITLLFGPRQSVWPFPFQRRHNGRDSLSNHQPHNCSLNRLFRRR